MASEPTGVEQLLTGTVGAESALVTAAPVMAMPSGNRQYPAASAENALTQPSPASPGWETVTASAIKLWFTLRGLGQSGETTLDGIEDVSWLGKRTIEIALRELESAGWLHFTSHPGRGIAWRLLSPPRELPGTVLERHRARVERRAEALERYRDRLANAEIRSPTLRVGF